MTELLKSDDASSLVFSQGVSGNAVILFIFTLPLYIPAHKFFDDNIMCLKNPRWKEGGALCERCCTE